MVELNRAVAITMRDGPAAGLALVEAILARGDLKDYHLAHAARADLCRRLGKTTLARAAYKRANLAYAAGARAEVSRAAAGRVARLNHRRTPRSKSSKVFLRLSVAACRFPHCPFD